jgi:hypothetical protein
VAFSPDNTKLYVSCGLNALYQFDLADPTPAAILASRVLISNQVDATVSERYGALQLAPDGRIYHAHAYTQWVGAIHDPNAKGAACNYVFHEMNLGAAVLFGLPNLIDGFFATGSLACGAPAVSFTPGDTTICAGSCLDFTDMSTNNPTSWNWSFPGANRQSSTAQHPAGICYDAPGTYRVTLHASNARGAGSWSRDVVVAGRGDLKAHFGGSYSVAPGDTLNVPLVLDAPVDAARLAELKVTVDYGAGMLHLDTIDPSRGVLAGWTIDSLRHDRAAGRCTLYVSAAPGAYLQGTGTLADLRFRVFLGQSDTAELRFDISSLANRCLGAGSEPGRAVLAICDARNRLIEIGASSFALDANRPNPFNPSTTIPYSIGLGGHVTLTIRDALGRIVATLVDGDLAAGSYIARWDAASAPSGIYFYAIETGPWRAMRRMVLVK